MIKVHITNNGTYQNCALPDRIQWEKQAITAVIFLPKMQNPNSNNEETEDQFKIEEHSAKQPEIFEK